MYKISLSALRFRKSDYQQGRLIVNPYEIMAKRLASSKSVIAVRQGEKLEDVLPLVAQRSVEAVKVFDESLLTLEDIGQFIYIHVQGEAGQRGVVFIGADEAAPQSSPKNREVAAMISELGLDSGTEALNRRSGYNLRHYGTINTGGMIDIGGTNYYLLTQPSQASNVSDINTIRINGLEAQVAPLQERLFNAGGVGHDRVWGYLFEVFQPDASSAAR